MNYILTIQVYQSDKPDKQLRFFNYKKALAIAKLLSELLPLVGNWTRHSACAGVIHHMDSYSDLFNEGAIILKAEDNVTT